VGHPGLDPGTLDPRSIVPDRLSTWISRDGARQDVRSRLVMSDSISYLGCQFGCQRRRTVLFGLCTASTLVVLQLKLRSATTSDCPDSLLTELHSMVSLLRLHQN
jgi:hypothetical protein